MSVGEKLEELINERNRNPFEISIYLINADL